MHTSRSIELLAPAGGWPHLRAAINAKADAVFFGAGHLNMRARAKNFSLEELSDVCELCHQAGVKAYLTLNTIVYESELHELENIISAAKNANVDAVIAADFAVISAAKAQNLPVHASTQLSVSNSATLRMLMEMGIHRVVLARECSIDDLAQIRKHLGVDAQNISLEVFAHGAMCVAVSGRCFLSGFETGRSANRGDCCQPCRREYDIQSNRGGEGFTLTENHLLSPKDLCTLPFLEKLLDSGVASLKIEGRNRSPDYVHTVVTAYRNALDFYQQNRQNENFSTAFTHVKAQGIESLKKVYNRGFSEGFYMGKPLGDWRSPPGNQSSHKRDYIGQVIEMDSHAPRVIFRLESSSLREKESIFFESPEIGYHAWQPIEMKQADQTVTHAEKGSTISLPKLPFMHKNLKMYRLQARKP